MTHRFKQRLWCAAALLALMASAAAQNTPLIAQNTRPPGAPAANPDAPTEAAMREREKAWRSCPDGYYRGPRPRRTSWVKDPYIWAVSREFAKRFCMPEEFIADDLKGAEAIAYRLRPTEEEACAMVNGQEKCSPAMRMWIELYVKSGAIPKYDRDVTYFNDIHPLSRDLVTNNHLSKLTNDRFRGAYEDPHGRRPPFFGLSPKGDGKRIVFSHMARTTEARVEHAPAALIEDYYVENWSSGIDLIGLRGGGGGGGIGGPRAPKATHGYVLAVHPEGDNRPMNQLTAFPYVIQMPSRISTAMKEDDRTQGEAHEKAVNALIRAFMSNQTNKK